MISLGNCALVNTGESNSQCCGHDFKIFFFFLIIFEIIDKIFARFLPWRVQKQNIVALGSVKQFCSLSQCCVSLCTLKILCITLQSDYCNWVHLDKIDQSDYRKLTILWTKKVCCRLRVVPHFSSGIVGRAKCERAWKSPHARKGDMRRIL